MSGGGSTLVLLTDRAQREIRQVFAREDTSPKAGLRLR